MNQDEFEQFCEEAKMLSHCAPLFFLPDENSGPTGIHANGTATLLDTGKKKLLVTCAHVWTDFSEYRKNKGTGVALATIFRNGPGKAIVVNPESLIDCGSSLLDMAIFEAYPEKWDMGFKQFHRVYQWPIPKVKVGKPVSFVGFAGAHRTVFLDSCFFDYSMFGSTVTDVSNYQFILADRG